MGADTKANTRGGGALERGDSRLFEDGSERGGALGSDKVVIEAAMHRRGRAVRDEACQWALTRKRTHGVAAHLSEVIFVSLRTAASAEAPSAPMPLPAILQEMGWMSMGIDTKAKAQGRRRT